MPPKKQEIKVNLATIEPAYFEKVNKLIENVTKRKWAIDLTLVKDIADMTEAILNKLEAK